MAKVSFLSTMLILSSITITANAWWNTKSNNFNHNQIGDNEDSNYYRDVVDGQVYEGYYYGTSDDNKHKSEVLTKYYQKYLNSNNMQEKK